MIFLASEYYTNFKFKATGLSEVKSQFRSLASYIEGESKKLGQIKFSAVGLSQISGQFSGIVAEISRVTAAAREMQSALAQTGATKMGGAGMASFAGEIAAITEELRSLNVTMSASVMATKNGFASLGSSANSAASSVGKVGSSGRTIGANLKAGVAEGDSSLRQLGSTAKTIAAEIQAAFARAGASIGSSLKAATASSVSSLGGAAKSTAKSLIPLSGSSFFMSSAASMAPLTAGMFGLVGAGDIPVIGGAAGLYTYANLEKQASMAAAKQGLVPGKEISVGGQSYTVKDWADVSRLNASAKQSTISVSNALAKTGDFTYSPTEWGELVNKYGAMGGDVINLDQGKLRAAAAFGTATDWDASSAMESIYSNLLMRGDKELASSTDAWWRQANIQTALANESRLSPEDINMAEKYATPVARNYGVSDVETAAILGVLGQSGRTGTTGGTDLRRILMRSTGNSRDILAEAQLEGTTMTEEEASATLTARSQALKSIGLDWKDVQVTGEEGHGIMDSINNFMSAFEKAGGVNSLEAQGAMSSMYGIQGVTPMLSLYNAWKSGDFDKMLQSMNAAATSGPNGTAMQTTKTATDNLWGSFDKLKASVGASLNAIGAMESGPVKSFIDTLTTKAVPALDKFGSHLAKGEWKEAGEDLKSWAKDAVDGVEDLSEGLADFVSGGGVGSALGGIGDFAKDLWGNLDFSNITSNLSSALGGAFDQASAWLEKAIDSVNWSEVGTSVGNALESAAGRLLTAVEGLPWSKIGTAVGNALSGIAGSINWSQAIADAFNVGLEIGAQIIAGIQASNIPSALGNLGASIYNAFVPMLQSLAGTMTVLKQDLLSIPDKINPLNWFGSEESGSSKAKISSSQVGSVDLGAGVYQTSDKAFWFVDADGGLHSVTGASTSAEVQSAAEAQFTGNYGSAAVFKTSENPITQALNKNTEATTEFSQAIGSGKFDTITAKEILVGDSLYQSTLDSRKYVGSEGYSQLGAAKENYEYVGQADLVLSSKTSAEKSAATSSASNVKANQAFEVPKEELESLNSNLSQFTGWIGDKVWSFADWQAGISVDEETGQFVLDKTGTSLGPVTNGVGGRGGTLTPDNKPLPGSPDNPIVVEENPQIDDTNTILSTLPQDLQVAINQENWSDVSEIMGKAAGLSEGKSTISADTAEKYANERGTEGLSEILASMLNIPLMEYTKIVDPIKEIEKNTKENATQSEKLTRYFDTLDWAKNGQNGNGGSSSGSNGGSGSAAGAADEFYDKNKTLMSEAYHDICDPDMIFFSPELSSMVGGYVAPGGGTLVKTPEGEWMTPEDYEATGHSIAQEEVGRTSRGANMFASSWQAILSHPEVFGEGTQFSLLDAQHQAEVVTGMKNGFKVLGMDWDLPEGAAVKSGYDAAIRESISSERGMEPVKLGMIGEKGNEISYSAKAELDEGSLNNIQSEIESQSATFKVDVKSNADAVLGQLSAMNGSSTWIANVIVVKTGAASSGNTGFWSSDSGDSGAMSGSYDFGGTPNMSILDIPMYDSGGYTGNYEGRAYVHPHEVILNEAQQKNVASAMNSSGNSSPNIYLSIDARGAIITGNTIDSFADKITKKVKANLQSESLR